MMSIVLSKLEWYGILPPRHSSEMYTSIRFNVFATDRDGEQVRRNALVSWPTTFLLAFVNRGPHQRISSGLSKRRQNTTDCINFLKGTQEYLFKMKIVGAIVLSLHLASAFVARDGRLARR